MIVFKKSYPVATTMVGIDKKNENSSAAGRDKPATCPAAMVDIDREVPGKTAESICAAPNQTACGSLDRCGANSFCCFSRYFAVDVHHRCRAGRRLVASRCAGIFVFLIDADDGSGYRI